MRAVSASRRLEAFEARLLRFVIVFVLTLITVSIEPDYLLKAVVFHNASLEKYQYKNNDQEWESDVYEQPQFDQ